MKEIWKDIPGYEDYQVSNLGNVRSLKFNKVKILKPGMASGYFMVKLWKNGKIKPFRVHQLVAMSFLNHKQAGMNLVIDHINGDPLNNNLENLRIVTQRENNSFNNTNREYSSQYTGVCYRKDNKKWIAQIQIEDKRKHLGHFKCETTAHLAYEKELKAHLDAGGR